MTRGSLPRIAPACCAALLLGALMLCSAPAHAEDAGLRVILDRNNPPYSSMEGHPPGLDAEIAGEISRRLERPLQVVWADTLDDGLLTPVVRPGGEADIAVGVPIDRDTVEEMLHVGEQVLYSLPYAATGYVLVTSKDHEPVDDLKQVGRGVIGVEVGSVAAMQLWDNGYLLRRFGSQDRILNAIAAGDLEYGVVWSNGGWLIEQDERLLDALTIQNAEIDMRKPRWNVAVAVGRHNRELLPVIDSVIYAMRQDGVFESLYEKYHIPYFDPFEEGSPEP